MEDKKRVRDKVGSGEKSGKNKTKKDEAPKGVKKARRHSLSGANKELVTPGGTEAALPMTNTLASTFSSHLLRNEENKLNKLNSFGSQRLDSERVSIDHDKGPGISHGLASSQSLLTLTSHQPRKKEIKELFEATNAQDFKTFHENSSSESDETSSNSSSSSSSDSDASLSSSGEATQDSTRVGGGKSFKSSDHVDLQPPSQPNLEKALNPVISGVGTFKHKGGTEEQKKKPKERHTANEASHVDHHHHHHPEMSLHHLLKTSTNNLDEKSQPVASISKDDTPSVDQMLPNRAYGRDTILAEIVCDFADFMYTIAAKVSAHAGLQWVPKAQLQNDSEDAMKKSHKKKAVKDPNEPRRPLSSFNLWCESMRKKLKGEDPTRSIGLQELANLWKLLSPEEKISWEESAKEQKELYLRQMEAYKANCPSAPSLS